MDILYTFLVTLVAFCCLEVYLLWFVRRRRLLSKKYEKEAITVLGNVEYNEQYENSKILGPIAQMLRWNDYGTVIYDLERVGSHPACDYAETCDGTSSECPSDTVAPPSRLCTAVGASTLLSYDG